MIRRSLPELGRCLVVAACGFGPASLNAQAAAEAGPGVLSEPSSYDAGWIPSPLTIDGVLDELEWRRAVATEAFQDIRGPGYPVPTWDTRVRILWDRENLYVGAVLEEPHLWGTLTDRDAIIYHDHDFEIFVDPDGDGEAYFELEVNVLGTEFDLFLDRPYSQGGRAHIDWDFVGLRTAVAVQGTVNDATDTDRGWTVEVAIPWSAFVSPDGGVRHDPPVAGEVWRLNFSRVQWPLRRVAGGGYERAAEPSFEVHHEDNWVWSAQGEINMHIPERWGFVRFIERKEP